MSAPLTVGLEEEVMLLDPGTLDLAPVASEVLESLRGDPRFVAELPASQLEILTPPAPCVADAIRALAAAREDLAAAADGLAVPAVAGVHPFAASEGELSDSERYRAIRAEYGAVARRQLVASLQVHVALGDRQTTLHVYNRLRCLLPELAALAANARCFGGRDSGMASVRPKISELLPRQGVPPALRSWEELERELDWGRRAGALAEPTFWWWELRPHPAFGTLEVRVADAQTTLADAAGVVSIVRALGACLAGDEAPVAEVPTWRIEENRWSAARHGVEGEMADLESGEREPTRRRLDRLLDRIEAHDADGLLDAGRRLMERNGAVRQRELVAERGAEGVARWLAERFLDREGLPKALFRDREAG